MRKRALKRELEAANAELERLRSTVSTLELERRVARDRLEAERSQPYVLPPPSEGTDLTPAGAELGGLMAADGAAGQRIIRVVQAVATVIDERLEREVENLGADEIAMARQRAVLDRYAQACRDAEMLLSAAEPSAPVRAAFHALSIARREVERIEAQTAQLQLEAGRAAKQRELEAGAKSEAAGAEAVKLPEPASELRTAEAAPTEEAVADRAATATGGAMPSSATRPGD